jgi:hypothetical protein
MLVACAPSADAVGTAIAQTQAANPTVTNTPSRTPRPTNTPKPTNTPRPTFTPTPIPTPILLSGDSSSVVDVEKWDGPAIVHITYSGGGHFSVWNYGPDNEPIDLLVNHIGSYEGTRPLDFLDAENTARFEINANGQWEIQIVPFSEMRHVNIPGVAEGSGDDVILLYGSGVPDIITIDASQAKSNFVVWGWGNSRDLLVNEIAPYSGTVLIQNNLPIDNGALVLVIEATGNWTMDIKTR